MADAVAIDSVAAVTTAKTWTSGMAFNTPGTSTWATDGGLTDVTRYTKVGGLLVMQFRVARTPTIGTASSYFKITGPDNVFGSSPPTDVFDASGGFLTLREGLAVPAGYSNLSIAGTFNVSNLGLDFVLFANKSDGSAGALIQASDFVDGVEVVISGTYICWLS